jgi:hypothetical protein
LKFDIERSRLERPFVRCWTWRKFDHVVFELVEHASKCGVNVFERLVGFCGPSLQLNPFRQLTVFLIGWFSPN